MAALSTCSAYGSPFLCTHAANTFSSLASLIANTAGVARRGPHMTVAYVPCGTPYACRACAEDMQTRAAIYIDRRSILHSIVWAATADHAGSESRRPCCPHTPRQRTFLVLSTDRRYYLKHLVLSSPYALRHARLVHRCDETSRENDWSMATPGRATSLGVIARLGRWRCVHIQSRLTAPLALWLDHLLILIVTNLIRAQTFSL